MTVFYKSLFAGRATPSRPGATNADCYSQAARGPRIGQPDVQHTGGVLPLPRRLITPRMVHSCIHLRVTLLPCEWRRHVRIADVQLLFHGSLGMQLRCVQGVRGTLGAEDGGLARYALGEAVEGLSQQMNRVQVAADSLSAGKVDAIMLQQDYRLHAGDNTLFKSELRLACEHMQGLAHNVAQENADMRRYTQHLGAMVAQLCGRPPEDQHMARTIPAIQPAVHHPLTRPGCASGGSPTKCSAKCNWGFDCSSRHTDADR